MEVEDITSALGDIGVPLSVAETHGLSCGLLCTLSSSAAKARWFTELLDAAELDPGSLAPHAERIKRLDAWFVATQEQLDAPELVFEPALPSDDVAIGLRIDALGDYCAGFTYGVGLGVAAHGNRQLPADTRELLEDFQAIDGVERGAAPAGDNDASTEADYLELVEYVRVGVLLILEELKPVDRNKVTQDSADSTPSRSPSSRPSDSSRLH